jgi:hypothetical protein
MEDNWQSKASWLKGKNTSAENNAAKLNVVGQLQTKG